jgi:hypothetical protein
VSEIDPIKFGQLVAQVETLQAQMSEMRVDMKQMLELANKSKGGFWMGMTIAAGVGSVMTWIGSHIR